MKKALSLLIAGCMALSMAACGGSGASTATSTGGASSGSAPASTASEASTGEKTKVVVGYMPNYGSLAEVVSAQHNGYFEEQGLEVELMEFADGPTIIAAMESGSVQVGYIGSGAHKLAIQGQAKIFCMAHVGNADAVVTDASKGIETIEDLKGKTVGYSSGTSSEQILKYALEAHGMTMDDIKAQEMDASALVTAMLSGSLDASAAWSPMTFTIQEQLGDNYKVLADNMMFSDQSAAVSSWIVTPKYAEENADTILAFTKALMKAKDFRADEANYEQIAQWVADQTKTDYETCYQQRGDAEWQTSAELIESINDGSMEQMYKVQQEDFLKNGQIEAEVPVSDYVMFDNMLAAAE